MYGSTVSTVSLDAVRPKDTDRDARLRRMVEAHFDVVWRTLKRLGAPDPDDAAQKVMLTAATKLDVIEPAGERGYLLGIALRVASDARRAAGRRIDVADGGESEEAGGGSEAVPLPDALLDEKRAREVLARALDRLTPDLRDAFVLFELEELSASEVASLLEVPEGTVASRVRRAREQIRASLERWSKSGVKR